MYLLEGKVVKDDLINKLKGKINELDTKLGLVVIQVGDDPASNIYIKQKEKLSKEIGINFNHIKLPNDIKENDIISIIDKYNNDDTIDGILLQLPIPKHLNAYNIQNAISPFKDVDGLTDVNIGKLCHNSDALVPCTPLGIMYLLDYYHIDVKGKNVTIVGRSNLVGKPLALLLTNKDATVDLCHHNTKNLREHTSRADILFVAVGIPNFIKKDDIKDNAIVIDIGINRVNNKISGDVFFDDVKDKVSYITPVPGGVGPMTVTMLMYNVYKAHVLRNSKDLK